MIQGWSGSIGAGCLEENALADLKLVNCCSIVVYTTRNLDSYLSLSATISPK